MTQIDTDILVCIFNYRHDENAKRLLRALQPHFETVVLDSGNDHTETEFTQFPNIYYSGLWNEMLKLAAVKPYRYVMQICSDVQITDENMTLLIAKLNKLLSLDNIGIWQPASDMNSRKNWTVRVDTQHKYTIPSVIEGWMMVISADVLKRIDPIDTKVNLYGYAIDILTSVRAKEMSMMIVIDNTVQVCNPAGTGYDTKIALQQGNAYLKQIIGKNIHQYVNSYTHTPCDHIDGLD